MPNTGFTLTPSAWTEITGLADNGNYEIQNVGPNKCLLIERSDSDGAPEESHFTIANVIYPSPPGDVRNLTKASTAKFYARGNTRIVVTGA